MAGVSFIHTTYNDITLLAASKSNINCALICHFLHSFVMLCKAYFGGEARCDLEAGGADTYNPEELVCGGCSDVSQAQMCPKHGTDYLEYKCRYCCSVAVRLL